MDAEMIKAVEYAEGLADAYEGYMRTGDLEQVAYYGEHAKLCRRLAGAVRAADTLNDTVEVEQETPGGVSFVTVGADEQAALNAVLNKPERTYPLDKPSGSS